MTIGVGATIASSSSASSSSTAPAYLGSYLVPSLDLIIAPGDVFILKTGNDNFLETRFGHLLLVVGTPVPIPYPGKYRTALLLNRGNR